MAETINTLARKIDRMRIKIDELNRNLKIITKSLNDIDYGVDVALSNCNNLATKVNEHSENLDGLNKSFIELSLSINTQKEENKQPQVLGFITHERLTNLSAPAEV